MVDTVNPTTPTAVQGQVSATESVQNAQATAPAQTTTKPVPTPEEIMRQTIAAEVTKALAAETEKSKREIQSAKDRARAEVEAAQRRAKSVEDTVTGLRSKLSVENPDLAKDLELEELRAKERTRQEMETEEGRRRSQEEFHNSFMTNLKQAVSDMGVDPSDKNIDWDSPANDYFEYQRRIIKSATDLQKSKTAGEFEAKLKEVETRIKKDLGFVEANSVDTSSSGGGTKLGIPTDTARFREWIKTIPQDEYEKKYAAEVTEMRRKGLFK